MIFEGAVCVNFFFIIVKSLYCVVHLVRYWMNCVHDVIHHGHCCYCNSKVNLGVRSCLYKNFQNNFQ